MSVAAGTCYGRSDLEPAPDWEAWADALPRRLGNTAFGLVLSSPASRCRRPAERVARRLGLALRIDDRLRELDFGDWEGRSWSGIDRNAIDDWAAAPFDFVPPGGEPVRDLLARSDSVAAELRAGPATVLVSHGGPLRLLDRLLRGLPADPAHPPPPVGTLILLRTA